MDFFKTSHGLGRLILSKIDQELRTTFQIPQKIVNFELGKTIEKDRLVVLSLSYSFHTCCSLMKLVIALVWLSWGLCGSVVEHWSEKRDFRFLMRTQNCSVLFFFFVPRSKQHESTSSSTTFQIYFIDLSILTLWIIVARCAFRLVSCSLSASSSSLRSFHYAPRVREQWPILNLLTQFQSEAWKISLFLTDIYIPLLMISAFQISYFRVPEQFSG